MVGPTKIVNLDYYNFIIGFGKLAFIGHFFWRIIDEIFFLLGIFDINIIIILVSFLSNMGFISCLGISKSHLITVINFSNS